MKRNALFSFLNTLSTSFVLTGICLSFPASAATSSLNGVLPGHLLLQVGAFNSYQGKTQNIGITGLIGDQFTVTTRSDIDALLGIGYFLNGFQLNNYPFTVWYGLNAFYLAPTVVRGQVYQEHLFDNLTYRYRVENFPLYLAAKGLFGNMSDPYNITLDAGIGPNFMNAYGFIESSNDGITIPDNPYSNTTTATLSASLGIGVLFNKANQSPPLECGYRLFYLGQGQFDKNNSAIQGNLKTGDSYANALLCSFYIS